MLKLLASTFIVVLGWDNKPALAEQFSAPATSVQTHGSRLRAQVFYLLESRQTMNIEVCFQLYMIV
jgi:hypothetical protein